MNVQGCGFVTGHLSDQLLKVYCCAVGAVTPEQHTSGAKSVAGSKHPSQVGRRVSPPNALLLFFLRQKKLKNWYERSSAISHKMRQKKCLNTHMRAPAHNITEMRTLSNSQGHALSGKCL